MRIGVAHHVSHAFMLLSRPSRKALESTLKMPERITSRQNSRVRALRTALQSRKRSELIAIEGTHLLEEALNSGLTVQTVFLRDDQAAIAAHLAPETEVLLLSEDAFSSAAATEHSQGVAALCEPPESRYLPQRNDLILIAAGLQDPGNLGTLIRSAEAFGAAAMLLAGSTVDPWNGKSLRASAGSAFRLPLLRLSQPLLEAVRRAGIVFLAAVPSGGTPAHLCRLDRGCALLIGNEGAGLSTEILALADERIMLPTSGRTESLNAAVAGSLLLYEAHRQRLLVSP